MYDHVARKEVKHSYVEICPECYQDIFDFGVCQCRKRDHYMHLKQEMDEVLEMLKVKYNAA